MERLPKDITRYICLYLDNKELINICLINKEWNYEILNDIFWLNKLRTKFPELIDSDYKYKGNNTLKAYYLYLVKSLEKYKNKSSDDILIDSAKTGKNDLVIVSLTRGANIHASGDWALRLASEYGHAETVKLLLEMGADIHAYNDEALRWSSDNKHTETVKLLLENGADIRALTYQALE